ncbi:hypothetical protein [Desulfoluna spongiiphila]|uniref:hypothetical protein n=1 Tax=Desulfoluna spongiiphila TaxID=419481 RepID=UPI0012516594|nr:hypothetical protein [Desulfoluna spongiiphila]VVS95572.1 hypothetical protein DBB_51490 [Desulfoluna spongiiphila]
MPVTDLKQPSSLSEPKAETPTYLKQISGRQNTIQPLTKRSYQILQKKLTNVKTKFASNTHVDTKGLKLGLLNDRPKIPRTIGLKMTDLTESYSQQMWALVTAALSIDKDEETPFGPELEGVLETSRAMAKRFQEAVDEIERCYAFLREESSRVVTDVAQALNTRGDVGQETKRQLFDAYFKRYLIDHERLGFKDVLTPKHILLPLLKGKSVYRNKAKTLQFLTTVSTKTDRSTLRIDIIKTKSGTSIQMLCQVQPKFESRIYSDHAGFVCVFSNTHSPPLFIYYHSLEHGHQHTNTRIAQNYGAFSGHSMAVQGTGTIDTENPVTLAIHNPRDAYVDHLHEELDWLITLSNKHNGNVLVVIGECTSAIHEGVLDLVLAMEQDKTDWSKLGRVSPSKIRVHGAPTTAAGYDLKLINASKPRYQQGKPAQGLGVHALMGYLFINTRDQTPRVSVTANMLTLTGDGTDQNILTVTFPNGEKHAFTHLLNGKEDALAKELGGCGYASVGGDLNNITIGTELVATHSRDESRMSMGSNSKSDQMYDKIVILK